MKTDEKTLDNYFAQKGHFKNLIEQTLESLKDVLKYANEAKRFHDHNLHSAAAEYILDILRDPNNRERYGRSFLNYIEIKKRFREFDARFEDEDIHGGLIDLLRAEPPKIESETLRHQMAWYKRFTSTRMAGYKRFTSTIYKLKEDTK